MQFSSSTWLGFGGGRYASRADLASRAQQIVIAEKVLNSQGWGAWPACSAALGLDASDANATDDRLVGHYEHPWRGDSSNRGEHVAPLRAIKLP
ncbi:MAG: transglycosylase family protein [Nocardioidaceae bacterium]